MRQSVPETHSALELRFVFRTMHGRRFRGFEVTSFWNKVKVGSLMLLILGKTDFEGADVI